MGETVMNLLQMRMEEKILMMVLVKTIYSTDVTPFNNEYYIRTQ